MSNRSKQAPKMAQTRPWNADSNLRKRRIFRRKEVVVIVTAIILTTAGIKAADNLFLIEKEEPVNNGSCGTDMVLVNFADRDFCIDKYEMSLSDDCKYKNPTNTAESQDDLDSFDCKPISISGAIPWTNISQNQAVRACAKVGKRLPTNKEWTTAALGTPDPSSDWNKNDCQVDNNWNSQPGASGSGKNCVSYAGAFDMIGNVWEWTDSTVQDGNYQNKKLPQAGYIFGINEENTLPSDTKQTPSVEYYKDYFWIKNNGTRGISRGGYWGNQEKAGQYSYYIVDSPASSGNGIGFRCVKNAKTK